jgi:hypothetical protein
MSVNEKILINDVSKPVYFEMLSSTDDKTPVTELTVTVKISVNNSTLVTGAGTVTEVGLGAYSYIFGPTDVAVQGRLLLIASASGAIEYMEEFDIEGSTLDELPDTGFGPASGIASAFGGNTYLTNEFYGNRNIFLSNGQ